jgi:hypothetical protein
VVADSFFVGVDFRFTLEVTQGLRLFEK